MPDGRAGARQGAASWRLETFDQPKVYIRLKEFRAEELGSKARRFTWARPNKPLERTAHSAGFFQLLRYRRKWAAAHRRRYAADADTEKDAEQRERRFWR
jgi:hypothetical protein